MINYLKGILCGIGGVIPGLSGSVLLVIFGLYEKTIAAIGTLFKNFKENVLFLFPLVLGFASGIILFSKVIDFALLHFEVATRFTFFGLIIGTLPVFFKEVKKYGFKNKYYLNTILAFAIGFFVFYINRDLFARISDPTLFQSFLIGIVVALASIVPGLDSASTLSSLGLYEAFVSSLAHFDLTVLIPAGIGLGVGVLCFSYFMNRLLKRHYTATFATIFGLFISIIPRVLSEDCKLGFDFESLGYVLLIVIGFMISYYFGDIKGNNAKIKSLFNRHGI